MNSSQFSRFSTPFLRQTSASLDADDIYDDDIHEMVDHAGGSAADRAFTIAVLRAALFDESFDGYLDAADEDSKSSNEDPDDDRGADSSFLDDLENAHLLDTEPGDTEPRDTELGETDDAGHNNFLADLANTVSTTTSELVAAAAPHGRSPTFRFTRAEFPARTRRSHSVLGATGAAWAGSYSPHS